MTRPSGNGILNPMHLPREPTLVSIRAAIPAHRTLGCDRPRAAMAINAHSLGALDTVEARRLPRNALEDLELLLRRLVLVGVVAFAGGQSATVRVQVVHVAHFDLLDALQLGVFEFEGWVDAVAFLVVGWARGFDWTGDEVGLRLGGDGLGEFGPGLGTGCVCGCRCH